MPARDGTGPMGSGSQTGRGMGNCGTTSAIIGKVPTTTSIFRRSFSLGRRAWGFCHLRPDYLDAGV